MSDLEPVAVASSDDFLKWAMRRPAGDWLFACIAGALAIFVTDLLTPLGYPHALLYVPLVIAAGFTADTRLITWIIAGCIALGVLAAFLLADGWPAGNVVATRTSSLLVVLLSGAMVRVSARHYASLSIREHQLQATTSSLEDAQYLLQMSGKLASLGGWQIDMVTGELKLTDTIKTMLKLGVDEKLRATDVLRQFSPDHAERLLVLIREAMEHDTGFDTEFQIVTRTGERGWFRVIGEAAHDQRTGHKVVQGALKDISRYRHMETARDAQEQMLAERSAQLEEAQRIGNMGSWSYDHARDQLIWSPQLYVISGVDPKTFSHDFEGWLALIHVEDHPLITGWWDTAPDASTLHAMTYRLVRPNGEVRYVRQKSEATGNGTMRTGTLQDVTKQVKDELALRESEERFRMVTEVSADIIWDWNIETGKIWWNDREPNRFGYGVEHETATIDRWTQIIHPEDLPLLIESLTAAMQSGEDEWSGQYRVVKADGSHATVCILAKLIQDAKGSVVRLVGSMNDVTERLLLEARLRSASKLEAVGQLTGGIAHDFNNLLTVILGNAELLEDALEDQPKLQGLARMSRTAAEKGGQLTSRLLSFARRQALDPRSTDIAALITDMTPLLHRTLGAEIEFITNFEDGLCPITVDPSQLENALLNLCINARDAMSNGGRIYIEAANVTLDEDYCGQNLDALPGEYVRVTVTDSGTGMSPETLARTFEPFFTTKPAGKGSGLGLSMVYGFAKQSSGHVRIYSELGYGTTVRLYLPRAATPATIATVPAVEANVGGQERILLVEDDVIVREHACGLLNRLGYHVSCAGNGPEALAELRKGTAFDLLFTDVMMPGGMNGRQLADAARALRPSLPILFTSGYAENAIVNNGQLDPGVHFLAKPYRKAELAKKVREALAAAGRDLIAV